MSVLASRGFRKIPVTILNGASLSAAFGIGRGVSIVGIQFPAAWTAANITMQGSHDNTNFFDLYDNATEFTITGAASRYVVVDPQKTDSILAAKLRSGTSGLPVAQGADRILTVIVRDRV